MSGSLESAATANAQQLEYWRSAGEKWRTHQERLDRQMAGITQRLLERAAPVAGERAIDVGCGAGDSTLRLARAVGGGAVLGLDISETLLQAARQRAQREGVRNVEFLFADAQVHGFEAGAYDLAASRFGVMFFDDPVAAFRHLARALRPGGRFTFAAWGPLQANPWFLIPQAAAIRHLGPPQPQPPRAPGPMAFSDAAYVRGLLAEAGLEAVEVSAEEVLMDGGGSLESLARFSCNLGPASRRISETGASPEIQAAIAAEVAEGLSPYAGPEGVKVPALLHYISARRG